MMALARPGADDAHQLLARGALHPLDAAEACQQRLATPRADAGNHVELRPQVARRPRLAMEGHGETVRLVADPLQQTQRGAVRIQGDRPLAVADEDELLFLGEADRERFASPISSSASYAAFSCPFPPSITIRSGNGPPSSSTRL